ncbi:hypothetical protein KSS87_022729, partial [Heliosperma pusillum]
YRSPLTIDLSCISTLHFSYTHPLTYPLYFETYHRLIDISLISFHSFQTQSILQLPQETFQFMELLRRIFGYCRFIRFIC